MVESEDADDGRLHEGDQEAEFRTGDQVIDHEVVQKVHLKICRQKPRRYDAHVRHTLLVADQQVLAPEVLFTVLHEMIGDLRVERAGAEQRQREREQNDDGHYHKHLGISCSEEGEKV